MAYDKSLMWGVLMLVMIPVIMGFIGSTFDETITTGTGDIQDGGFFGGLISFFQSIADYDYSQLEFSFGFGTVTFIANILEFLLGGFAGLVVNVFVGYSIFPWWFNVVIIGIPAILVIRSVIST